MHVNHSKPRGVAESLEPRVLLATLLVTNTRDSGAGSLRQAILDSNALAGSDVIQLNIASGSGMVKSIVPLTALPAATDTLTIDATTQPGWAPGRPVVELDGFFAAGGGNGLEFTARTSGVKGMIIDRWSGAGVVLRNGPGDFVEGCWIGLNADGAAASPNAVGISLENSAAAVIGGNTLAQRNVISGNTRHGVLATTSDGLTLSGCYVGTNPAGTAAVANGACGVVLDGTSDCLIGGFTEAERNVISANRGAGVLVVATTAAQTPPDRNLIAGNYIGTDAAGAANLGNRVAGVALAGGANHNSVGVPVAGGGNLIAANFFGVFVSATNLAGFGIDTSVGPTHDNTIAGNQIGLSSAGAPLANGTGIQIQFATDNLVGGNTEEARNVISGNATGVAIWDSPTTGNRVTGNYIGLDPTGRSAVPNSFGVSIERAPDNFVGGAGAREGNVISGNLAAGVHILQATGNKVWGNLIGLDRDGGAAVGNGVGVRAVRSIATLVGSPGVQFRNVISGNDTGVSIEEGADNQILGNFIGTDVTGRRALPNDAGGVAIVATASAGSSGNKVGGPTASGPGTGAGNVISGNGIAGVTIQGVGAVGNWVSGNLIGLDATGTAALPNAAAGVAVIGGAHDNVIGGDTRIEPLGVAAAGVAPAAVTDDYTNVISANALGVLITAPSNEVSFNFIGTDRAGGAAIGNTSFGIQVFNDAEPAGLNLILNNLISGNAMGVQLRGARVVGTQVRGNHIGTNAAGTAAVPNRFDGVAVENGTSRNVIGTLRLDGSAGNVVSGNRGNGIRITDASQNVVLGNFIGTAVDGTAALGNVFNGVLIAGASDGNQVVQGVIAYNGGVGVSVTGGTGNEVTAGLPAGTTPPPVSFPRRLSIHSNGGLGIDLGPVGVTPNDAGDADAGPNGLQNFPVLSSVTNAGGGLVVVGTLNGTPIHAFRIDFFTSAAADSSGYGEGQAYLGSADVTTDALGNASFTADLPGVVPTGHFVSATATSAGAAPSAPGDTSEFSAAVSVAADAAAPTVRQVYVGGTWTIAFANYVRSQGLAEQYGFFVPDGAHQLDPMPWSALNSVAVRFSEPVNVDAAALSVRGVNVPAYAVARFAYDPATYTAAWLLDRRVGVDKLRISLSGGGAGGVTDLAGFALDGEWADAADAYPSGNGTPGGDFRFRVNVLPGDATGDGRVNALDMAEVKRHLNGRVPDPGSPPDGVYSVFSDIDTSGHINALDVASVRRNLTLRLPTSEPAAAAGAWPAAPSMTRDVLGDAEPIPA